MTCEIGVANSDGYRSGGLCNLFSGSAVSVAVCKKGLRADSGLVRLSSRHGSSVPERWERGLADQS